MKPSHSPSALRLSALATALAFFSGCGSSGNTDAPTAAPKTTIPSDVDINHIALGQAYDTRSRSFYPTKCAEGVEDSVGGSETKFKFSEDQSVEDLLVAFHGSTSADVQVKVVKVGAYARLALEHGRNKNKRTTNISFNHTPNKKILKVGTFKVADDGRRAIEAGSSSVNDFCGDEFVTAIEYGASGFVNLTLEYMNEQDVIDLGTGADVEVLDGRIKLTGDLSFVTTVQKNSVKVTFDAYQWGADSEDILKVAPKKVCTLANVHDCIAAAQGALDYFRDEIPAQLKKTDAKFVPVRFTTSKYKAALLPDLVVEPPSPRLAGLIDEAKKDLERKFAEQYADRLRAQRVRTFYSEYLSSTQTSELDGIEQDISENLRTITKAVDFCDRVFTEECLERKKNALKKLKAYDKEKLSVTRSENTPERQCEKAAIMAVNSKVVSAEVAQKFLATGLGPVFVEFGAPEKGLTGWTACSEAAKTYLFLN